MKPGSKKDHLHREIFHYTLLGIAFLLPVYGPLLPSLIAVMVANWIAEGRFGYKFRLIKDQLRRRQTLGFAILYILYLLGLLYSSDFSYGVFDIEVKLSILIFPMVLASSEAEAFYPELRRKLLRVFIFGCLAGSLLLIARAVFETFGSHEEGAFYYGKLSWYFHSSYLSMYYNLALVILLNNLTTRKQKVGITIKFMGIMLILWFLLMVFLLSSKAGILTSAGVFVFFSFSMIISQKKVFSGIGLLTISTLIFCSGWIFLPGSFQRMERAGKVISSRSPASGQTAESTSERLSIWKVSLEIIKQHYLTGVGTGDVKDVLCKKYSDEGMEAAFSKRLNSHCQYLQTFVALGLAGVTTLLLMLILPGITAIKSRDVVYLLFICIFAFNILVESMFEVQAGVVFYAFFNTYLFMSMNYRRMNT